MKNKWNDVSPAILSLLFILIIELMKSKGITIGGEKEDFEIISNILLFAIGAYGFFVALYLKGKVEGELIRFCGNVLVVICACIVNIDIFEHKIQKSTDILSGWHILWLIWLFGLIFVLVMFEFCKKVCIQMGTIFLHELAEVRDFIFRCSSIMRKCSIKTFFEIVTGVVFCFIILFIDYNKNNFSSEECVRKILIIAIEWLVLCMVIELFVFVKAKTKGVIEGLDTKKALSFCMKILFISVVFIILLLMAPKITEIVKIIFIILAVTTLAFAVFIYVKKKVTPRFSENLWFDWHDMCFLIVVFVFVTFTLIPFFGMLTYKGTDIVNSGTAETITKYMELFIAGLELFRELVL